MKIISRIVALILFIVFFGFALKNTDAVTLRFFLGYETQGPLVLMLLIFFAVGALCGVMAMLPSMLRYRREQGRARREVGILQAEKAESERILQQPPHPDMVRD